MALFPPQIKLPKFSNLFWALLILVLFIIWMLTGIFSTNSQSQSSAAKTETSQSNTENRPNVAISLFTPINYTRELKFSGQTAARYRATIAAQTSGRIETLNIDNGTEVKKGQHLATINAAARRVDLASAKASLAAATKLATSARKLEAQGYLSQTVLAEREAAEAEAKARVQNIQQDLTYTRITAPINGVIENRRISAGDFASIGNPMFDVVNRTDLLLTVNIPQKDRSSVQLGQEISAKLITGDTITGVVDFIATDANTSSRTYQVNMAINVSQSAIPTGMSAEVYIPAETVQAYNIPHNVAILGDDGQLGVMQLINNRAAFVPITVLEDSPQALVVTASNNTWQRSVTLITRGQLALVNGAQVTAEPVAQPKN